MSDLGDKIFLGLDGSIRPPPDLSLSQWADRHFYLSAESAAEPGRWTTLPYQRGIMDAITDAAVDQVSFMKSARVGATKMMNATIAYHIHQDPCPIMMVQPTVEDAQGYSKEEISPMLRDCSVLAEVVDEQRAKDSRSTMLSKTFPGGSLSMVGANSGRGFRRVSRRVVIFDEVDAYPASAGSDGDPIKLGIRRTEYYWNRKIIAASTPLTTGVSRIESLFESGDQRRYHVPCPHCGHSDILVFRKREDGAGHYMIWPKDHPEKAHFVCSENGCIIEHGSKFDMLKGGEWKAEQPFEGHASFHIWAAYSMSPNASWAQIAREFMEANEAGPEQLQTFINTVLGETFTERGDAPSWERIYNRRERYLVGSVPEGVVAITCGVDVQKDRFVYEVVGWSHDRESWSIDSGLLFGDTSNDKTFDQLDALLQRGYEGRTIDMLAIDSGAFTQHVYNWARRYPMNRVIAVKGSHTTRTLVGIASPVDITARGRRMHRGYRVWPVGVSIAKKELYGWLRLSADGEVYPAGYCHFPEYGEEFFLQLTAEQLVKVRKKKTGFTEMVWQLIPGRENHFLDCRVYARAAASVLGIDRAKPSKPKERAPSKPAPSKPKGGGWIGRKGGGWIR